MNYKLKLLLTLFSFLLLQKLIAQQIDLPVFETPEKSFYKLLQEEKIKFPEKNNGKLKSVKRIFNTYTNAVLNATETEVTFFDIDKKVTDHYFIHDNEKFDDYSEPPILYKDSIDGFLNVKIIEDEYSSEDYFYKNNLLVKHTNTEEELLQTEDEFTYNSAKKLIRHDNFFYDILYDENDTALGAAKVKIFTEKATFKNNQLTEKSNYLIWEGILTAQRIKYGYDDVNRLLEYTLTSKSYNSNNLNETIELDKQNFSELQKIETETSGLKGNFTYDKKGRIKTFKLKNTFQDTLVEDYKLSYMPNITVIYASLNNTNEFGKISKLNLKYEYTFDTSKNPILIKSYYKLDDTFVLDKETKIKIEYYKN